MHKHKETLKKIAEPYNWEYFFIGFIDVLLYIYSDKEGPFEPDSTFAMDYLSQIDDWGELELQVFIMFMFTFDVETVHFLMEHTVLKKGRLYEKLPQARGLTISALTNAFSVYVGTNRITYAEEAMAIFEQQFSTENIHLKTHMNWLFNKSILSLRKGDNLTSKEHYDKAIDICKLLNQQELEDELKERYYNWTHSIDNPDFREIVINIDFFFQYK